MYMYTCVMLSLHHMATRRPFVRHRNQLARWLIVVTACLSGWLQDGVDGILLGAETLRGKYAVETIRTICSIAR